MTQTLVKQYAELLLKCVGKGNYILIISSDD
ncbi:unnamed protein product, partial [Rotaria sp. Silwood1]